MGVLVKTSLFICILWGIHIWIKQVIDTEENNQKMGEHESFLCRISGENQSGKEVSA